MPREVLDEAPFDGGVDEATLPGVSVRLLQTALEPIRLACEKKSVVPDFRYLQINPDNMVIIGSMASVKVYINLGFDHAFSIDAQTFCGVISFLVPEARVIFDLKYGVLTWKSGNARGKLATLEPKNLAFDFNMQPKDWPHESLVSPNMFGSLAIMGAVSGNNNMLAGGSFCGVVVYPDGPMTRVVSTDNATLALAWGALETPCDVPIYLHPSSLPLIAAMAKREGRFFFNQKAVAFKGSGVSVFVNQITEPKFDFLQVAEKYANGNMSAKINKDALLLYTKRVAELSERSNRAIVSLTVTKTGITLKFSEGTIENEEDFDVATLEDLPSNMELRIGADNLANALARCDEVILDFVDRNVLVFQGTNFQYIVSGKPKIV